MHAYVVADAGFDSKLDPSLVGFFCSKGLDLHRLYCYCYYAWYDGYALSAFSYYNDHLEKSCLYLMRVSG